MNPVVVRIAQADAVVVRARVVSCERVLARIVQVDAVLVVRSYVIRNGNYSPPPQNLLSMRLYFQS